MMNAFPLNATSRYTRTAIGLHWLVAVLILGSFAVGLYMVGLKVSPFKLRLFSYHKWIGVTVFLLALARIVWRWRHRAPALPAAMRPWERIVAHATHMLLYVLLLAVPLTGWLMSSAHGFPVVYFGVIPLPDLVGKNKELAEALETVHYVLNKSLLILVLLHAAAAIKHHYYDHDDVLARMLPGLRPRLTNKEN
jgi:cytochrome b561